MVRDPDYEGEFREQKVAVWNPTFANLTLMALGSSAPEIILNTFETCTTLGSTPGELGASTIVGSASFNFLVISGVSIYAVSEAGESRTPKQLDEDKTPKGVKKVDDLGVFAITTTWSVIAYIWLFYVLLDYEVEPWEAYLTFGFFWILIIMAVSADMYRRNIIKRKEEERIGKLDDLTEDEKANMKKSKKTQPADACIAKGYEALDFYNCLLPLEKGERIEDPEVLQKQEEMKDFLMREFGKTKVSGIDINALKEKLGNVTLIERIGYRKQVGIAYAKEAIEKGAIIRRENKMADTLDEGQRNPDVCFPCLHYSVSEGAGMLRVKIQNKTGKEQSIGVRTVDAEATSPKDYIAIDQVIEFKSGRFAKNEAEVSVKIIDDEQWEPDEDFFVELYDINTGKRLIGEDTRTRVTIMDDDRPGMLAFAEKK